MNILFVIFTVACAVSSNLNKLIGFQFLAGAAGSSPLANGGGTISDLVAQEKRGAAMALFGIGPLLGPVVGPVAGGYLAEAEGWRWVFWVIVKHSVPPESPFPSLSCRASPSQLNPPRTHTSTNHQIRPGLPQYSSSPTLSNSNAPSSAPPNFSSSPPLSSPSPFSKASVSAASTFSSQPSA